MRLFLSELCENHLSCGCLQNTCYCCCNGFSDITLCTVNNDHCAVVKVGNALIEFFSFFNNINNNIFAGATLLLSAFGKIVDVENGEPFEQLQPC